MHAVQLHACYIELCKLLCYKAKQFVQSILTYFNKLKTQLYFCIFVPIFIIYTCTCIWIEQTVISCSFFCLNCVPLWLESIVDVCMIYLVACLLLSFCYPKYKI